MEYVTGETIRTLREKRGLTQKALADLLGVSDKTVSKWETGRGLPDVTLLSPLAGALRVSLSELLSGEYVVNRNRSGNMKRVKFYLCPICGNVIQSAGEGAFSCCGVDLPPLEAEQAGESHDIVVDHSDGDLFVTMEHPMSKEHHITFLATVTSDRVNFLKTYPEQSAQGRFPMLRQGMVFGCCNIHGLFVKKL